MQFIIWEIIGTVIHEAEDGGQQEEEEEEEQEREREWPSVYCNRERVYCNNPYEMWKMNNSGSFMKPKHVFTRTATECYRGRSQCADRCTKKMDQGRHKESGRT